MTPAFGTGAAVVSLADGSTLGSIDQVFFDPRRMAVAGFTFHHGGGLFGGGSTGLVDISDVHAFGPDAITISDVSVIRSELAIESQRGDLLDLEELIHRPVLTVAGTRVGRVAAVQFGDTSYRLVALDVAGERQDERLRIAVDDIKTIGDDLIIVADRYNTAPQHGEASRPLRVIRPAIAPEEPASRRQQRHARGA
jgi:sporulation protein YlmC with PRC-barrel domain